MTDITLLDAATFRELAHLQARDPLLICWITFSPDGRWLAACTASNAVQLWDLRMTAQRLASLGLDGGFINFSSSQLH